MQTLYDAVVHEEGWLYIVLLVLTYLLIGIPTALHAIFSDRDVRSTIAWMGLIWLTPLVGAILYALFGVNRIRRAALRLRDDVPKPDVPQTTKPITDEALWQIHEAGHGHLATLEQLVRRLTRHPLHTGNTITHLTGGDEAYPAMLAAIEGAGQSITLSSYIFDNDEAGTMFADALEAAQSRGVEIRVLIDAVGARYSRPTMVRVLRRRGIRVAKFLSSISPTMIRFFNLRNHRKILVVDGQIGFTGGMNIRACCMTTSDEEHDTQDLHFRIEGPAVADLQHAFSIDWAFSTDELLQGPLWFQQIDSPGDSLARGISDGPDEDMDHLRLTFMGALSCARRRVQIVTPYFLPEGPLIDALNVCAMRGVEVDVILPSKNNLPFVHWAMLASVAPLLKRGVRIWLTPPPFDHTKLMIVDGAWCCFGSTNWDPRSLRLNFEFNVECYDREVAGKMSQLAQDKIATAKRLTLKDLRARSRLSRLRDGIARLFLPYL